MIQPESRTISEILKSIDVQFTVPKYQRSYDWGKSELKELIDDLKGSADSKGLNLFLGNFIFDVSDERNFQIVDGQQRLTTIALVLIALREHAKKLNEIKTSYGIQSFIYRGVDFLDDDKGPRISVSENIRDIFNHISENDWNGIFPEKIGNKQIRRQVAKIKPIIDYVLSEVEKYNLEKLNNLLRSLTKAYVIVIKVEKTEEVFAIFERTNARGLDLNIGDLLKNLIFQHGINEFEENWNDIVTNADGNLVKMLKYFWISRNGYIQQSSLYKSLKEYSQQIGISEFVGQIYEYSRYFKVSQSYNPEEIREWLEEFNLPDLSQNEDYYKKLTRVFQSLKLFRVTQANPLIFSTLYFYRNTKEKDKSRAKLFTILEAIEKYHFVNNVISGRIGNEVEREYAENAMSFYHSKDEFIATIDIFLNILRKKKAYKDDFVVNFIENMTYDLRNIPLLNYVFDRFNNFQAKGGQRIDIFSPEKDLKKRNYNIEHFLPQSKRNKGTFLEDERELFDKIGNLLIVPSHSNPSLGDKEPIQKIEHLNSDLKHQGGLRIVQDFLEEYSEEATNWNFESIKKRSNSLAKLAYDSIWNF